MITLDVDFTKEIPTHQVVVGAPYAELGDVFSSDFRSVRGVEEQVAHLRAVAAGAAEPVERTGNAYVVTAGRESSTIECLYTPMELEIPTATLIDLLERWGTHVRRQYRNG